MERLRSSFTPASRMAPTSFLPHGYKNCRNKFPDSTIVECNVPYGSPRQTSKGHRETLKINGWNFSRVDIMDEDGEAELPSNGAKYVKRFRVGKNLLNYDSMLVLTHFKGHTMGGFGGSMKTSPLDAVLAVRKVERHSAWSAGSQWTMDPWRGTDGAHGRRSESNHGPFWKEDCIHQCFKKNVG